MAPSFSKLLQLAPLLSLLFLLAPALIAEPIRLSIAAFGSSAEIEIRDLPQATAEAAARAALEEIYTLDRLLDPKASTPGGLGQLNGMAGLGPLPIDHRVADLLQRTLQFCAWSGGAFGPLAGELNKLWRDRGGESKVPEAGDLRSAVIRADCPRLSLIEVDGAHSATLGDGSRVELGSMARGFAIDEAFEILKEHGADNAWVEIGNVWRGRGAGPEGEGWLAILPPAPGSTSSAPLDQLWLDDQALAVIPEDFETDGRPIIDQRTGVPARGVIAIVTVSELAVDAAGLAEGLFVIGLHEGQMRIGALKPPPSIYWLLGDGIGQPLESAYRWSEVRRLKQRR